MLMRLFPALVFVVCALGTPVNAACVSGDGVSAQCCCCLDTDTSSCSINGNCCPPGPEGDSALPKAYRNYPHFAFVGVAFASALAPAVQHEDLSASLHGLPVHLASNKLYLKKRALLI